MKRARSDNEQNYGCTRKNGVWLTHLAFLCLLGVGCSESGPRASTLPLSERGVKPLECRLDELPDPVDSGSIARGRFTVHNVSRTPLVIEHFVLSCGCTSVLMENGEAPEMPISIPARGAESFFVEINTRGRPGDNTAGQSAAGHRRIKRLQRDAEGGASRRAGLR